MEPSELCDLLKAAMQEITFDGITGTGITWGADGEPVKEPIVVEIKDGAYEFVK